MFSNSIDFSALDVDRDSSKELNRIIQDKKRKKIVLHSLLHSKCKFCASSFSSKGCRNCCLPLCQNLTRINTKKLLKNTNLQNAADRGNKKYCSSLGKPMPLSIEGVVPGNSIATVSLPSCQNSTEKAAIAANSERIDPNKLPIEKMSLCESKIEETGNPSAPCLGLVLFNNEEQSDIVFLVGAEENQWRFPAHSVILLESSHFFKDILNKHDGNNNRQNIRIDWCDPTSFKTVLKYLYTKEIALKCVSFALNIFNASNGLQINQLSIMCLAYLSDNCTEDTVLEILSFFNNYLRIVFLNDVDKKLFNERMQHDEVFTYLNDLILKCYSIIDQSTQKVISSEEFANLDWDLLEKLLSRDTLTINTELVIFEAINQWALEECKRMRKELNNVNKREVLGSLIYYPRYLTMSFEEYTKDPYQSDLLPSEDKELFLELLKSSPIDQDKLEKKYQFFKLAEKRKYENINDNSYILEEIEEDDENLSEEVDAFQLERTKLEDEILAQNLNGKKKYNAKSGEKRKKTKTKRIMNRLGDIAICMIKVLD